MEKKTCKRKKNSIIFNKNLKNPRKLPRHVNGRNRVL